MGPSPALELKYETFGKRWVGEQFKAARSSLRLSGLFDSFRPENAGRTLFGTGIRQFMVTGFPRNLLIQFNPPGILAFILSVLLVAETNQ
ncbi:hypothetical protein CEXT_609871 [Caerostris extrusa]|uniref:Uncharacterized protein n=1 Tax=Caerostris extrusa TaxID=172846 RepID=A0AAV4NSX0_CAEEX|nr:hypothetical protein CEXT_609871 [Caerostris extrusa]